MTVVNGMVQIFINSPCSLFMGTFLRYHFSFHSSLFVCNQESSLGTNCLFGIKRY